MAGLSYLAWFWLIARHSASRLSAFSVLTPVFGVLAGVALLGERVGPLFGLAVALVAAGLWLVNRRAARRRGADCLALAHDRGPAAQGVGTRAHRSHGAATLAAWHASRNAAPPLEQGPERKADADTRRPRPAITRRAALVAGLGAALAAPAIRPSFAQAAPIKVGVLHSLSGTMAISETALRDTVLMMVRVASTAAAGCSAGGSRRWWWTPPPTGRSSPRRRASCCRWRKVDVTFGCWTSVSRKSVLPVFEELNGLLFYPVQYEGEEESQNIFYTGAAPNQQAIPAVRVPDGRRWRRGQAHRAARHRLRLSAHHQPHPARLPELARASPTPTSWRSTRPSATPTGRASSARVKRFAGEGKKTAIVSTINGDANVPFYRELGNQGIKAEDIPSVAFSRGRGGTGRHRHQAAGRPPGGVELLHVACSRR